MGSHCDSAFNGLRNCQTISKVTDPFTSPQEMLDHPSFRSPLVKLITTEFLLAVSEVFVAVLTVPELDPEKSLG